jgi:hypothetical protein
VLDEAPVDELVVVAGPVDQGVAEGDGEVEVLVEAVPLPNES